MCTVAWTQRFDGQSNQVWPPKAEEGNWKDTGEFVAVDAMPVGLNADIGFDVAAAAQAEEGLVVESELVGAEWGIHVGAEMLRWVCM